MASKLVAIRKPNRSEKKSGAEIVFVREQSNRTHTVLARRCHESWKQWGAETEILCDNVSAVERWRNGGMEAFDGN